MIKGHVRTTAKEEGPAPAKRGSITMVWVYAVKSAVSQQELTEAEGYTVEQCWHEADQLQESADKAAKFKKLLLNKYGPAKGNTIHELVMFSMHLW